MKTKAVIDIAAPREEVFGWLTEHDKLVTWTGSAGAMPEDTSQLKVGFTAAETLASPGGERPSTLTVTAWDPPASFGCTITYDGGDSFSTYTLTATATGTHLELTGDTDWAAPDLTAVTAAMGGQDAATAQLMQQFVQQAEDKITHGDFDPATVAMMQKAVDDLLAKLKGLVEGSKG